MNTKSNFVKYLLKQAGSELPGILAISETENTIYPFGGKVLVRFYPHSIVGASGVEYKNDLDKILDANVLMTVSNSDQFIIKVSSTKFLPRFEGRGWTPAQAYQDLKNDMAHYKCKIVSEAPANFDNTLLTVLNTGLNELKSVFSVQLLGNYIRDISLYGDAVQSVEIGFLQEDYILCNLVLRNGQHISLSLTGIHSKEQLERLLVLLSKVISDTEDNVSYYSMRLGV